MKLLTKTAWVLVLLPFVANAGHHPKLGSSQEPVTQESVENLSQLASPSTAQMVLFIIIAIVVIIGAWWIFKKPRK